MGISDTGSHVRLNHRSDVVAEERKKETDNGTFCTDSL